MTDNVVISIELDTAELDRIQRELGWRVDTVIRRMAFEMEGFAKQEAPLDTGALRNSIYTNTTKGSKFAKADAAAKAKNPDVETTAIPEAGGDVIAVVGACVTYAAAQETGAPKRNVPAHPYLVPAAEKVRAKLADGSTYKELLAKAPPREPEGG